LRAVSSSRYQAWLVDLDGTLYAPLLVKLAMAGELMLAGWGAIGTLRRFRHEHERLRHEQAGGLEGSDGEDPFSLQLRRTAEALALESSLVEARVREWMFERPGKWLQRAQRTALLEEIAAFRKTGGRTALVSDYPARDKLRALGVEALFEVVVASGEPNGPSRLKPHPQGYLRAAALLGVPPEQCLVIGDRDDADGAAAQAAKMAFRRIG
jgi:HAD superfamily hydrolase (TIGR01549 family)